ncbi:MAG: sensor histidine kinase [Steroidobacteraceae bacterium]
MHPIVTHRDRLLLYLAVWIAFGALLALVLAFSGDAPPRWSLLFALPLSVLLGAQALWCWYLVRVLPPGATSLPRFLGTWLGVGLLSLAIWVSAGLGWRWALRTLGVPGSPATAALTPLLLFGGSIGLLVSVLGHYMVAAFELSRDAERHALELRVLAREAELRFLRGQLDPHFLFNSLNSVAALIGSDAAAARRMCFLMSDFFRKSLGLAAQQSIPLSEELALAETYLAIEQVRFGERLRPRFDLGENTAALLVPALVLQPLVENAVHHGVAHLLEGGELKVSARRYAGLLELAVENPCDPDRPASRGTGVGLANVRARIDTLFGNRARIDVVPERERFRVLIILPTAEAVPPTTAGESPTTTASGG